MQDGVLVYHAAVSIYWLWVLFALSGDPVITQC